MVKIVKRRKGGRRCVILHPPFSFVLKNRAHILEAISKMQITFKDKARADEKTEHTREYVNILRRPATSSAEPSATP
jgi:hypothetical protein